MKIVFFTGAGISKESGIDTFRDIGGLWDRHAVMRVASAKAWRYGSKLNILEFHDNLRNTVVAAEPNDAHRAIAQAHAEFDAWVVTQNVDDLHERAGSPADRIIHMHGEILSATDGCRVWRTSGFVEEFSANRKARPDVVWFGEPVRHTDLVDHVFADAEAVVVVGTTLSVYPAAGYVFDAVDAGKSVIVVNPGEIDNYDRIKNRVTHIKEPATTGVPKAIAMILEHKTILQK